MKMLLLLLVLGLVCLLTGCSPPLSGFVPFETEALADTDTEGQIDPAPFIPTITLDGRRYSFDGDPSALRSQNDQLILCAGGRYRLCGLLYDGALTVEAGVDETVELILDGLSLTSLRRPCLTVTSPTTVILRTESGSTNIFKTEADQGVVTHGNLVLDGAGALTLRCSGSAIVSDSALTVQGGSWILTAANVGLCGSYVEINGGNIALNGSKVGIYSTNLSKLEKSIQMHGGSVTVLATEVAIRSEGGLLFTDGKGSLNAPKLYEGTEIDILGGEFPPYP